jgi:hypothetical protein
MLLIKINHISFETMEQNKDMFSILVTSNIIGFTGRKSNNSFLYKFDSDNKVFSYNNNLYYLSKMLSLKDNNSCGSLSNTMSDLTDSETSNSVNSVNSVNFIDIGNSTDLTNSPNSINTNTTNESLSNISPTTSTNTTAKNSPDNSPTSSAKYIRPQQQSEEYNFIDDNYSIRVQGLKNNYEKVSIPIPFIVQSSRGERTFIISENKKFSLRANICGDLYILTGLGQICWICNNSRYGDRNIYGQPILELSNYGEIIFSIDGRILFTSMKQPQSGCYNLVLTNNCELITERTQQIVVEVNSFHKTIITKQVQSVIFKSKDIVF